MTPVATGHSALYKNVSVRQLLYCVVFVFQYQSDNSAGKLMVQMLLVKKKRKYICVGTGTYFAINWLEYLLAG